MNSDLLEITAGRAGGSAASYGATFTKEWVQTPAARRALLHSAQVYQLLANKQQTDMRSIYACFAVFQAALIMTLYVFASPGADNTQEAPTQPGAFEVTTLLDWAGMGAVGLDPNTPLQESAAARWIAHGGPWQFGGRHIDGFAGAIYLLDVYSDLLQTCGKWNYASMSRVSFRIVSLGHANMKDIGVDAQFVDAAGMSARHSHRKRFATYGAFTIKI